jgi:hypothetical protein
MKALFVLGLSACMMVPWAEAQIIPIEYTYESYCWDPGFTTPCIMGLGGNGTVICGSPNNTEDADCSPACPTCPGTVCTNQSACNGENHYWFLTSNWGAGNGQIDVNSTPMTTFQLESGGPGFSGHLIVDSRHVFYEGCDHYDEELQNHFLYAGIRQHRLHGGLQDLPTLNEQIWGHVQLNYSDWIPGDGRTRAFITLSATDFNQSWRLEIDCGWNHVNDPWGNIGTVGDAVLRMNPMSFHYAVAYGPYFGISCPSSSNVALDFNATRVFKTVANWAAQNGFEDRFPVPQGGWASLSLGVFGVGLETKGMARSSLFMSGLDVGVRRYRRFLKPPWPPAESPDAGGQSSTGDEERADFHGGWFQ